MTLPRDILKTIKDIEKLKESQTEQAVEQIDMIFPVMQCIKLVAVWEGYVT